MVPTPAVTTLANTSWTHAEVVREIRERMWMARKLPTNLGGVDVGVSRAVCSDWSSSTRVRRGVSEVEK